VWFGLIFAYGLIWFGLERENSGVVWFGLTKLQEIGLVWVWSGLGLRPLAILTSFGKGKGQINKGALN